MRSTCQRKLTPPRTTRRGTASVEFAACLLVLLPVLLGLWEVGRLVEVQQLVAHAAREGGRAAAAGKESVAQIKQDVADHLADGGLMIQKSGKWVPITLSDITVTVTNITSSSRNDPTTCNQLDHWQVQVSVPINTVRWVLLKQVTTVSQLTASADWYSMLDVPITINQTIPLN
jgi:Flp pilus assembly protein TadG